MRLRLIVADMLNDVVAQDDVERGIGERQSDPFNKRKPVAFPHHSQVDYVDGFHVKAMACLRGEPVAYATTTAPDFQ